MKYTEIELIGIEAYKNRSAKEKEIDRKYNVSMASNAEKMVANGLRMNLSEDFEVIEQSKITISDEFYSKNLRIDVEVFHKPTGKRHWVEVKRQAEGGAGTAYESIYKYAIYSDDLKLKSKTECKFPISYVMVGDIRGEYKCTSKNFISESLKSEMHFARKNFCMSNDRTIMCFDDEIESNMNRLANAIVNEMGVK